MIRRLIINDFKNNRLISIATFVFMTVSASLLGLTILMFGNLSDSIDRLMTIAGTPDFLQMHAGDSEEKRLLEFAAAHPEIEHMQISNFLNLENGTLLLSGKSLADNTQDNGLCIQNDDFDFLVDMDNNIIIPHKGEVYVPVCYRGEYDVSVGDDFIIGSNQLKVAGFLRDSQMNSMMSSSKRFLVSGEDYEKFRDIGSEEYLIEFKLKDGADINAFSTAYTEAGLPANGPTITYALIRLMNALSDGMTIFVILLVGIVILVISIICIRYILLTCIEKDKREIGMLKAVGISKKDIRRLYLSKFLILSGLGAASGMMLSVIIAGPLGRQLKELYGAMGNGFLQYLSAFAGIFITEMIIILSIRKTLKKAEKISTIKALNAEGNDNKRRSKYVLISFVTAMAIFLMLMPQNMFSTISSPRFVTYMGIGNSQIRLDIRQTDDIVGKVTAIQNRLSSDDRVEGFVTMDTGSYKVKTPSGEIISLLVESGDHGKYPVSYSEGTMPQNKNEIALSSLNARELGLKVGDVITVFMEEGGVSNAVECTVCGVYGDITNGGKTAKACFDMNSSNIPLMWSIIYVSLNDTSLTDSWINEYQNNFGGNEAGQAPGGVKVIDIKEYVMGTYGQTMNELKLASVLAAIASSVILFVVVLLFLRLALWQDKNEISLKKALGFASKDIDGEYLIEALIYILAGDVVGIFLGIVPGQSIAGLMLGSLGASDFHFILNPLMVFGIIPGLGAAAAVLAVKISLMEIRGIRAYECCIGRE